MKYINIDFEFHSPEEEKLELVCCSLSEVHSGHEPKEPYEQWLHQDKTCQNDLAESLLALKDTHVFIAHNVVAEARAFIALGLDPTRFRWFCTFAEWRCITNHYAKLRYGKHYLKAKGSKKFTEKTLIPKRWGKFNGTESKESLSHSMVEMVYKLLGEKIDGERKNKMRDIILSRDPELIEKHRNEIQEYCTDDIKYVWRCVQIIFRGYQTLLGGEVSQKQIRKDMLWRGESMARTAIIENTGYPINYEATKNFSDSVDLILKDIQRDINSQFPEMGIFSLDKKSRHYVKKEKPLQEWIENGPLADKWARTPTGKYSLSQEEFQKHFNYKHSYPKNNLGAQMLRFLKTKQSLNGFLPNRTKGKKTFWDFVGSDGRVRANLNPYGSQSARFQPAATGFLFLKAAWTRSLCEPPKGRCIIGIDYKSQEYLLAALISGDEKMKQAYWGGDVYIAYASEAGIAPPGASKKSNPKERDMCKPVVLGISYDQTEVGLASELTEKTGKPFSEREAKRLIDLFYATYRDYAQHKQKVAKEYKYRGYSRLPDGWVMWGDNYNPRSVGNFPIQGAGSCILREAIRLCQLRGLDVIIPLHDALYIESDIDKMEEAADVFSQCMWEAVEKFFPNSGIILEGEIWSRELEKGNLKLPMCEFQIEDIHVDERAGDEYEKFKKYFNTPGYQIL